MAIEATEGPGAASSAPSPVRRGAPSRLARSKDRGPRESLDRRPGAKARPRAPPSRIRCSTRKAKNLAPRRAMAMARRPMARRPVTHRPAVRRPLARRPAARRATARQRSATGPAELHPMATGREAIGRAKTVRTTRCPRAIDGPWRRNPAAILAAPRRRAIGRPAGDRATSGPQAAGPPAAGTSATGPSVAGPLAKAPRGRNGGLAHRPLHARPHRSRT